MEESTTKINISIIIPVFNGEKRIVRCLESIADQDYSDFECIVIDDGSTDSSYKIIETWIQMRTDRRFQLIHQTNAGAASARNRGIQMSRGEYLTFVDQDDYIPKSYLSILLSAVNKKNDILVSGYTRVDEKGKTLFRIQLKKSEWSKFIVTAPWAHLYRTEFIRKNSIHFLTSKIGEDVYFNIIAYAYADSVSILENYTGYHWVNNKESVSNTKQKKISNTIDPVGLLKKIHQDMPQDNRIPYQMREYYFLRYCIWYILFVIKRNNVEANNKIQKELFIWLESEYPNYMNNELVVHSPKGEIGKYHLAVKMYLFIRRSGLEKIFTKLFSCK